MSTAVAEEVDVARTKVVRTPTVLQMEAAECGAASLCMILGYYGRWVELEDLRRTCGVSRDGSKATNILKASRVYGLTSKGYKKEPSKLADIKLPAIIFWNFNHFLVLEGITDKNVRLNDPAAGRRLVSHDEFNESFTGVVLTFEPGPDFETGGFRPSALNGLFDRTRGIRPALLFSVIASASLIVSTMLVPVFTQIFTDYVLVQRLDSWLLPLLLVMLTVTLVRSSLTLLERTVLARLRTYLSLSGAANFMWHTLRLPVEYFAQRFAVEIAGRNVLNEQLANLLAEELAPTVLNMIAIVVYAIVMVQYDLLLTVIGIFFAGINLVSLLYASRNLAEVGQRLQKDQSMVYTTTFGGLSALDNMKATGTESLFLTRWAGFHAKVANSEQALNRLQIFLGAMPAGLTAISGVTILTVGGARVMDGVMSIGMLLGFQSLMILFAAPIDQLLRFGTRIQEVQADINRLDDVLRQKLDPGFLTTDEDMVGAPARVGGHLQVKQLSYGYGPLDPPLIDDFDLDLQPGARVAFVGGSGSGKSTIGKLIGGMYVPWGGKVLLGGFPIDKLPRQSLRHSIGFVDQNVTLFPGTIRDNISMWNPTLSDERIVAAAQDALIHSDIASRPGGYDYEVRDGGKDFSGGQQQRIILARALALEPSLIVLDEATSGLDAETEYRFMENLRRRGCSCIIVAHRLSTIRDCDEIIYLTRGSITERGRHDELMELGGAYRALVES